jgi:hypothetical protein
MRERGLCEGWVEGGGGVGSLMKREETVQAGRGPKQISRGQEGCRTSKPTRNSMEAASARILNTLIRHRENGERREYKWGGVQSCSLPLEMSLKGPRLISHQRSHEEEHAGHERADALPSQRGRRAEVLRAELGDEAAQQRAHDEGAVQGHTN